MWTEAFESCRDWHKRRYEAALEKASSSKPGKDEARAIRNRHIIQAMSFMLFLLCCVAGGLIVAEIIVGVMQDVVLLQEIALTGLGLMCVALSILFVSGLISERCQVAGNDETQRYYTWMLVKKAQRKEQREFARIQKMQQKEQREIARTCALLGLAFPGND